MKIGYHAVYDQGYKDAFTFAAAHGFDFVQFDLGVPTFRLEYLVQREIDDVRVLSEQLNVAITYHAPGDNISLFTDYPVVGNAIVDYFSNIIKQAEAVGARHVTVHTGNYPQFPCAKEYSHQFTQQLELLYFSQLSMTLKQLSQVSDSVMLYVENCNMTPIAMDVLLGLFELNDPIYLTLDIAKCFNARGKQDEAVHAFMMAYQDRIREVHVHDLIPELGSHQALGTGMIDFMPYRSLMQRPEVWTTIEVRPREAATIDKEKLIAMMQ